MEEIGGTTQITSQSGEGCKICLKVPLKTLRFRRFFFNSAQWHQNRGHQVNENKELPAEEMPHIDKA
jgi:hypothetical protein